MQMKRSKILHMSIVALLVFIMCLGFFSFFCTKTFNKNVSAYVNNGTYADQSVSGCSITDNAVVVGELWNTSQNKFDTANLQTLMDYIWPLVKDGARHNSNAIRLRMLSLGFANANNAETGKDIVVTLGGYKWEVAHISTDVNGGAIATLWLADNTLGNQMWQNNWYPSNLEMWGLDYPGNMYSTSYIRARLNGGKYAQPYTSLAFSTKKTGEINTTNAYFKEYENLDTINPYRGGNWANLNLFTSSSSALSDFIVTPSMVSWQMSESSYLNDGGFNWASKYTNSNVTSEMYNSWTEDKLWLPSLTETGSGGGSAGTWGLSSAQRSNAYHSWLRSGFNNNAFYSCLLYPQGYYDLAYVHYSRSVRPAFHFSLSSAVLSTTPSVAPLGNIAAGENLLAWNVAGVADAHRDGTDKILTADDLTITFGGNTLTKTTDFTVSVDSDAIDPTDGDVDFYKTYGMKRVLLAGAGDYADYGERWLYYSVTYQIVTTPTLVTSILAYEDGERVYINSGSTTDSGTSNFNNYDSTYMSYSGVSSATDVGEYTLTFSLLDTATCRWSTGGNATLSVKWRVGISVAIPSLVKTYFAYDGTEYCADNGNHSAGTSNIRNYDAEKMTYTGATGTTPSSSYQMVFTLSSNQYYWNDKTIGTKILTWSIRLNPVTLTQTQFTYNGSAWFADSAGDATGTSNLNNYYSPYITYAGTYTTASPGAHTMTFSLNSTAYTWLDGTTESKSAVWEIRLAKPNISTNSFTYSGSEVFVCGYSSDTVNSANTSNYTNFYNITNVGDYIKTMGTTSATDVGTYKFVFYLNNTYSASGANNYCWTDGTSTPLEISWSITPLSVAKPTVLQNTYSYDGSAKAITFSAIENSKVTLTNNSATLPGTHKVTVSLTDSKNHVWSDNSTNVPYTLDLVINNTYSISLSVTYDSTCDGNATAFAKIERTNSSYVVQSTVSEITLDSELDNPYNLINLNDGFYKISVGASTNHLASIASMIYNTNTYVMVIEVVVTKNNYGLFYGNTIADSQISNSSLSYNSPLFTSYLSFADGISTGKIGGFDWKIPTQETSTSNINAFAVTLTILVALAFVSTIVVLTLKKNNIKKGNAQKQIIKNKQ